jgi:uncharacterized protein (TIGR02996 family)
MEQGTDEAAFRQAFADAPLDVGLRRMFSDWLLEHDRPEEAAYYQRWTEDVGRAEQWLNKFAVRVGYTYEHVIAGARRMAEPGVETGSGMNFEPGNVLAGFTHQDDHKPGGLLEDFPAPADGDWMGNSGVNEKFWKCVELVLGKVVPEDRQIDSVFLCCEYDDETPANYLPPWAPGEIGE